MTGGSPREGLEAQLEAEVKIGGRGQNRGHGGHGGHGGRGPVWRPLGGPLHPIGDEPLKKF